MNVIRCVWHTMQWVVGEHWVKVVVRTAASVSRSTRSVATPSRRRRRIFTGRIHLALAVHHRRRLHGHHHDVYIRRSSTTGLARRRHRAIHRRRRRPSTRWNTTRSSGPSRLLRYRRRDRCIPFWHSAAPRAFTNRFSWLTDLRRNSKQCV